MGQEVGGFFHQNGVPGFGEHLGDQVEGLGGSVGGQQSCRVHRAAVADTQKPAEGLAKRAVTLGMSVVQDGVVAFVQDRFGGPPDEIPGEQIGLRLANTKVDHSLVGE